MTNTFTLGSLLNTTTGGTFVHVEHSDSTIWQGWAGEVPEALKSFKVVSVWVTEFDNGLAVEVVQPLDPEEVTEDGDGLEWYKAHGFKVKKTSDRIYWQTAMQTGEQDLTTGAIKWHSWEYFNDLEG